MRSLPKPMIGLLVVTLVFFALWYVELKPSSSTSGGSPSGLGQYQSAINKAHQAVATSNAANAKLGAPVSTTKAPAPSTTKSTAPSTPAATTPTASATTPKTAAAKTAAKTSATKLATAKPAPVSVATELKTLQSAVATHKVLVVLFYNGAAADDQAMKQELAGVPTHNGAVVKLAVPVTELSKFEAITSQIPVVTAPTLVVVDPARDADTFTGFLSQLELNQRVADALTVK